MGVSLHTSSPSEISSVTYGIASSPFGILLIAQSPLGIVHLSFIDGPESSAIRSLGAELPHTKLTRSDILAETLSPLVFQPNPALNLHLWGTEFQITVWKALLKIPFGQTSTYSQIAKTIHQPQSARAVGNAIGRNRIAYLIPCHRVTRQNGALGGYRWGTDCKTKMLEWEKANFDRQ